MIQSFGGQPTASSAKSSLTCVCTVSHSSKKGYLVLHVGNVDLLLYLDLSAMSRYLRTDVNEISSVRRATSSQLHETIYARTKLHNHGEEVILCILNTAHPMNTGQERWRRYPLLSDSSPITGLSYRWMDPSSGVKSVIGNTLVPRSIPSSTQNCRRRRLIWGCIALTRQGRKEKLIAVI